MGSVGLDPNAGFPVDLAVKVTQARYVDGTLVAARFDADLKLTGSYVGRAAARRHGVPRPHRDHRAGAAAARFRRGRREARRSARRR